MGTVKKIYDFFDIELTDLGAKAMQKYLDDNPRSSRPVHKYSVGSPEQIAVEREAYRRYQDYFNVPTEH